MSKSQEAWQLDVEVCERARHARDARFDGRFFIGVLTTGVYCRPICAVRPPKAQNVRFYPSAAAAADAGFRPCLRCRPESSPAAPVWRGTGATVSRALRLIDQGALDQGSVETLSAQLGVGPRHLGRLFLQHVGATPVKVAQTRRLHLAKKLLDETDLSMTEIAYAAGYQSVRRFNETMRATYQRPPRSLRGSRRATRAETGLRLGLSFRPPLDYGALLGFFAARAVSSVEQVVGDTYRRTIALGGRIGRIAVRPRAGTNQLELTVDFPDASALSLVVARVRRMFDLDADLMVIERDLTRDPALAPHVRARAGLRVPGAWDSFEIAVRAIVGQAISVAGARTILGRLVSRFGERLAGTEERDCSIVFPTPRALAAADLAGLGVTGARAQTIRRLARAVVEGAIDLETPLAPDALIEELQAREGIGPWTAQYVALRALGQPDAFPAGDLGLLRGAELCLGAQRDALTPRSLERRAEIWRPWRGYAAIHLWSAYQERAQKAARQPSSLTMISL